MKIHHPGALLMHVERSLGGRQDFAVEGAGAVYYNLRYWVEFLDERLRVRGAENILQVEIASRTHLAISNNLAISNASRLSPTAPPPPARRRTSSSSSPPSR